MRDLSHHELRRTPDHGWWIHIETDEPKTIFANGHVDSVPARMPGDSMTYSFALAPIGHHPGSELPGDPLEHTERYQELVSVGAYGGQYATELTTTHEVRYREQTAGDAPSLLVGVEPAYETMTASGVWGVVDGYDDSNAFESAVVFVDLELTMLAPFDAFDDRHGVRDTHEY